MAKDCKTSNLVGEEEEPEPFSYPVRRDEVMAAAKMKAKAKPSQTERMSLPAREVLAASPSMSKEQKKKTTTAPGTRRATLCSDKSQCY